MSALKAEQDYQAEVIQEASAIVSRLTGNQLGEKQAAMVQARVSKRMIELKMGPKEYLAHLRANSDKESQALVSLLTTHHTFFFREFSHFEFLATKGLTDLTNTLREKGRKNLRIWSAACSFGQEVYSLSMLMQAHLKKVAPDFTYEIVGTDIDPESVSVARNGVYKWEDVKGIPSNYLADHWARGTAEIAAFVKAKASIKSACRFSTANLMKLDETHKDEKYDVIFCRNVLIYFNQEQVHQIARDLLKRLEPHGYLFLGISESLMGSNLPVGYAGPSIYVHQGTAEKSKATTPAASASIGSSPTTASRPASAPVAAAPSPAPAAAEKVRVMCVDDSPVILSLLKKIFDAEPGYEVVATAKNGLEAAELAKKHRFDVMTLDIHMPGQTGVEYLEKNFGVNHPAVVMVTSVSREDPKLGLRCLELGAVDFVEKPALADFEQRGEELRMKVRCAFRSKSNANVTASREIAKSFSRAQAILNPETKARVIVCGLGDRERMAAILRESKGISQPATVLLIDAADTVLPGLAALVKEASGVAPQIMTGTGAPAFTPGSVTLASFGSGLSAIRGKSGLKRVSLMVVGDVSKDQGAKLGEWLTASNGVHLIAEDKSGGYSKHHKQLQGRAKELTPVTSFAYSSDTYLSRDL